MPKFHGDVTRLLGSLFAQEPFKSRKSDFNVRGTWTCRRRRAASTVRMPACSGGRPSRREYNVFDSERYVLTLDNRALRDAAVGSAVRVHRDPRQRQDLWRRRHLQRSGDGVGRQRVLADYVFVHEFGHHFAALADEYYTSDVAYETGAATCPSHGSRTSPR